MRRVWLQHDGFLLQKHHLLLEEHHGLLKEPFCVCKLTKLELPGVAAAEGVMAAVVTGQHALARHAAGAGRARGLRHGGGEEQDAGDRCEEQRVAEGAAHPRGGRGARSSSGCESTGRTIARTD